MLLMMKGVCTIQVQIIAEANLDEIYFWTCSSNLYGVLVCSIYNSIQRQATTHDRSRVGHMEREYVKQSYPCCSR